MANQSATSALAPRVSLTLRDPRVVLIGLGLIFLLLLPIATDSVYLTSLVAKMMIFAIAAASLDLIMGYGGMVSFGHAAYLGLGGYAVGILAFYGVGDGYIQFFVAVAGSAIVALFIGALSLRTGGLYFIMITLAFSQMIYYLGISLEPYGGDDGMGVTRSDFGVFALSDNLFSPAGARPDGQILYYMTLLALVGTVFLLRRFVNARFGMVVRGSHSNDARMQAIGFPTFRYRLTAFVIAGSMCGLAGALWANHQEFITPEYMHWFRSGEIMIMVLVGGMGTIFGPVIGAFAFLTVEEILRDILGEEHWRLVFGPLLVLLVLFAKNGIMSLFASSDGPSSFQRLVRMVTGDK